MELMVVVLVIAILIAIAIPSFMGARQRAQDRTAQANLTTGLKAESAIASSGGGFTDNAAALANEEPSLNWTGTNPEDIHVVIGDVIAGDNAQVLLYARSNTGTWFGIKRVVAGAAAGRYTCSGVAEANVDELSDCTGSVW